MHDNLSYVNNYIIEGSGLKENKNENEIVVEQDFFEQYHLKINDKVSLRIGTEDYDFSVCGVRKSEEIKTGQAYISSKTIEKYAEINNNQDVMRYYVVCKDANNFIEQLNNKFDDI